MINNSISFDKNGLALENGIIRIYNYDAATKEYIGFNDEKVVQGVGVAANACIDAPGKYKEGYAICRSANLLHWEYITDHRGEIVYSCDTGESLQITEPGEYPANFTVLKPLTSYDVWDGFSWVTDSAAIKKAHIAEAEIKKSELLADAKNVISEWQTELQLGLIDEADKASLISWLAYIKDVKAVETNDAPDLEWPTPPVEPAK